MLYTTPQHICFEKRLDPANIPLQYALDLVCAPSQILSISRTVRNTLVEFSTAEFKSVVGTSHWVVHEDVLLSTVMYTLVLDCTNNSAFVGKSLLHSL